MTTTAIIIILAVIVLVGAFARWLSRDAQSITGEERQSSVETHDDFVRVAAEILRYGNSFGDASPEFAIIRKALLAATDELIAAKEAEITSLTPETPKPRSRVANPGDRHGSRVILRELEVLGYERMVETRCDCGRIQVVKLANLVRGKAKSCGSCGARRRWNNERNL